MQYFWPTFQAIIKAEVSDNAEEIRQIEVPHSKGLVQICECPTISQLNRLKRQFISLSKTSSLKGDPGEMFVQYLNSQLATL